MGDLEDLRPRSLGDLPDELLIQVLELLPDQRDVSAMCQLSRRMNKVADPVLHKDVLWNQPKHHLSFSESLVKRPRRGSLIQNVRLDFPSSELNDIMCLKDSHARLDTFSHTLSTMSNLETLEISVPESMLHGMGVLFNGPFDLACLKTCSLFYQCEDNGYWDLQENIHIFSHPSLEKVTIRRAKIDRRGFESLEKPETELRELHFIECDINDEALSDLLMLPESLQVFTITQREVPSPPLEESPDDVEDYILAIRSAEHSLESISIDFPTLGAENPLRLRDFDSLKTLEIRDYQLFGQSMPRLHSVGLPPNLERLKFLNTVGVDEEITELLCYSIENRDIVARKLREIQATGMGDFEPKILEAAKATENLAFTIG